ncbi:hypothetical protein DGWBC_0932 [Dehalogenimonas sp. WBC-2]|nr:hypothetical protein DGWBC_0932 [Dehalogenimonas sp. WBC-2]
MFLPGQISGEFTSNDVALGDLNNDGFIDAFIANSGANQVYLNDGNGSFSDSGQSLGDSVSNGVSLGDLDGDGDLDAFVANGDANKVWLNNGAGIFADSGQVLGNTESLDVALGDLDGDGDLDAFIANFGSNKVWLNNGAGIFTESQSMTAANSNGVALGDLDSDGDLDAFVANSVVANEVWLNNGNGVFTRSWISTNAVTSLSVSLGDLDHDGDLDAFIANRYANEVWFNSGNASFTNSGQSIGGSIWSTDTALSDFDGDGDLDAFTTNGVLVNTNKLWLNNGSGVFSATTQSLGNTNSTGVALGDFNGDGYIDVFVTNTTSNEIWLNANPGITITSPVNGASWPIASSQIIRWTSVGISEDITIEISRNNGLDWATVATSITNNGSYPWVVSGPVTSQARIRISSSTNSSINSVSASFTIGGLPSITQHPQGQTITYGADVTFNSSATGDPEPTIQWQLSTDSGESWSDIPNANDTSYSVTKPTINMSDWRYRAVFENSNGTVITDTAILTITPRSVTVSAVAKNKIYGDTDPELTYIITNGTLIGGDSFSGDLTRTSGENVSIYAISQGTLALNSNYVLGFNGASLNINSKAASVSPGAETKIYGEADPVFTGTLNGFLPADNVTANYSREPGEVAGTYIISATLSPSGVLGNYNIIYQTATFTIIADPAPVFTQQPLDQQVIYGAVATFAVIITGNPTPDIQWQTSTDHGITWMDIAEADTTSYVISRPTVAMNGWQYRALLSNTSGTAISNTVSLLVDARPVTVAADAQAKLYGNNDPFLSYQLTVGALVNGDAFYGNLNRTSGENVGPYLIDQGTLSLNSNYILHFIAGSLSIAPRPVTVTADPQAIIYGDDEPVLTWHVTNSSLAFNDVFIGSLNRDVGNSVGEYVIYQGSLDINPNYLLSFSVASLTIGAKPAAVNPNPLSKIVGTPDPELTGILSGFLPADNITASYQRVGGETLGSYIINAILNPVSVLNNYSITYNTASFVITTDPSPVIIQQPVAQTITYGNNVFFSSNASGTPMPSVQWQVSTDQGNIWTYIQDAAQLTLTIIKPTVDMNGRQYRAVFTNSAGSRYTDAVLLTVEPKLATPSVLIASKTYDGTLTATIVSRSLSGVIQGDDVTLYGGSAVFTTKDIDNNKTVTITGLTLGGLQAGNYQLSLNVISTIANITTPLLAGTSFTGSQIGGYGFTGNSPFIDDSGKTVTAGMLSTENGQLSLFIPDGVYIWNSAGTVQLSLSVLSLTEPPDQSPQNGLLFAYELGPSGSIFNPGISLTCSYTASLLPSDSIETDLYIAWWDGYQWIRLASAVDTNNHTVTTLIKHFSTYALFAQTPTPVAEVVTPTPDIEADVTSIPVPVTDMTPPQTDASSATPVITPLDNHKSDTLTFILVALCAVSVLGIIMLRLRRNRRYNHYP